MKLYNVPRKTYIHFKEDDIDEVLFFDHVDGAYSLCYTPTNQPVHLAAWVEVEVLDEKPEGWDM
jgi:hypothetical protein